MNFARIFAAALLILVLSLGWTVAEAQQQQQRRPAPGAKKSDADQPIEITSDSLEVQQDRQLAIFRGRVQAVQGDMRLTADTVAVTYREQKTQQPPSQQRQRQPSQTDGAMGAITRIDATGNVFVSSPTETAQGLVGVYDVDKRVITLTGQVVLTRDKNVLKGENLVWNLETGVSRLDGGATTGGAPGGRVKGVFVPQERPR